MWQLAGGEAALSTVTSTGTTTTTTNSSSSSSAKAKAAAEASEEESGEPKDHTTAMSSLQRTWATITGYMNSTRLMVLTVLCLQNSMYTIFRRYSQGVLKETYSKVSRLE